MVVGSAPTYPQGVVDPIADIAGAGRSVGASCCHVDACMGGFLLPFLTELGRFDQPFDFRVPGVTSMSADVHKYGYASKGVSVVLYRYARIGPQAALRDHRLAGRVLRLDGHGGYPSGRAGRGGLGRHDAPRPRRLPRADPDRARCGHGAARRHRVDRRIGGAGRSPGHRHGLRRPRLRTRSTSSPSASACSAEGWYLDRQNRPDSLHATVHAGSAATVNLLVTDLRRAVKDVGTRRTEQRDTTYGQGV